MEIYNIKIQLFTKDVMISLELYRESNQRLLIEQLLLFAISFNLQCIFCVEDYFVTVKSIYFQFILILSSEKQNGRI